MPSEAGLKIPTLDIPTCVPGLVINPSRAIPTYSQYGRPMPIIGMGETALEKQIFEKYLAEMRRHCTPDNVSYEACYRGPITPINLSRPPWCSATS